jgi:hypothetical protein
MTEFIEIEYPLSTGYITIPVRDIKSASLRYTSAGTIFTLIYVDGIISITQHDIAEKNYKRVSEVLKSNAKVD